MIRILAFAFTLSVAAVTSACATRGEKMNADDVAAIQVGKTTKAEMLAKFGAPLGQAIDTSGKLTMNWFDIHVGPMMLGTHQQQMVVLFDTHDVVEKVSFVDSDRDRKTD